MPLKKSAVLAIILAVSIGVIVLVNLRTSKKAPEEAELLFKNFKEKNCSEMVFIERSDTARLKRKGATWNVVTPCVPVIPATHRDSSPKLHPEFPADSALLSKALETIATMKREELISVNPKKQADMEVDGKSGLFFECRDSAGVSLGGIYIGMGGPKSDSYFVRNSESDSVYLVGGGIRYSLFANPKRWVDKSIIKFDKKLVRKITIVSADSGTIEVEKRGDASSSAADAKGEWYLLKPVKTQVNSERVETLITSLSNLAAADFENDGKLSEKEMGFDRPATVTTISLSNGESRTIVVGGKDKAAMKWVSNPEKPQVIFTVYAYTLAGMNPGAAYLKDVTAKDAITPVEAAKSELAKQIKTQ